jgi:hypothetical protein
MSFGKDSSPKRSYTIDNAELEWVTEIKDLGITITPTLSWSNHIGKVVAKANHTFHQIKRCLSSHTNFTTAHLYKTYIRPQLEYANGIWIPETKKDAKLLDAVTYRCTKLGPQRHNQRQDRLTELNLQHPADRRLRGDLILVYKYFANKLLVTFPHPPKTHQQLYQPEVRSGSHASTYVTDAPSHSSERSYLLHRVASAWNQLPTEAVNAKSLNEHKDEIDKLFKTGKIHRNVEAYKS